MPPSDPTPSDLSRCEALLAHGSKTFSLASRLLPRDVRPAVVALYAFCRISDDLIDDGPDSPEQSLQALRSRLDKVYAGSPDDDPVDRALSVVVASHGLPRAWLDALLEGYGWDAIGREYRTIDDVLAYAARVAGSVGACMALFMGTTRRDVLSRACDLGTAMQLTNIARDVVEDARRGRVYLPTEWLEVAEVDASDLARGSPRVSTVAARLLRHADDLYERADGGIALLPPRYRRSIRAARWMYAEIGAVIRRRRFDISRRATVPFVRKLWLLVRSLFASSRERDPIDAPPLPAHAFLLDAQRSHAPQ